MCSTHGFITLTCLGSLAPEDTAPERVTWPSRCFRKIWTQLELGWFRIQLRGGKNRTLHMRGERFIIRLLIRLLFATTTSVECPMSVNLSVTGW